MVEDYWFEDLFPQTWQDVIEALNHIFSIESNSYSHGHAECIRTLYWTLLEER